MALSGFHPLVARWFADTLGEPTPAQVRGWEAIRRRRHTLIAAPTGSGKTLAAFLTAIDDLVRDGLAAPLPDEVRVLYISPLKALSADIHKNLAEPRRGIRELAASMGVEAPRLTAGMRTGDTTQSERAAMLRTPPHILVTTPESLYLLLTSARSRQMLRTVRTVIVDEIHAVIGTRRGAHLALSLERLQEVAETPLLRLGLSATQKPVDEVARFLVGGDTGRGGCTIIDEGHRREIDLAIEIPGSPLDTVMAHEVWQEYYDRLTALIGEHRTTLIFVNTRRLAERVARNLSERLGEDAVTAHHGSLSKETRLSAEARLKAGQLKALVATASLELGIDIGHVDLVCQIGSPHRIATLLQRVGRSGHTIAGTPKGRLMPVSRDDLIECAALLRVVRRGDLDRIVTHDAPLDVLAQQVTAEVACREYAEDELFALVQRAWPYRALPRREFDAVVAMLADGFATRRGRRAALVHRDEVHGVLRGRRGSRLLALTSGGAIPEVADYRVVLEPDETFVGTLNEDFAIESAAGDIFQLGNASWQVTQVAAGTVRVTDAHGAPPTIPFWLGEAPARSDELSRAVSDLRADIDQLLDPEQGPEGGLRGAPDAEARAAFRQPDASVGADARPLTLLISECGLSQGAAEQAAAYLTDGRRTLGVIPTQATLVLERFFDESGGMQLVLHAPFGSRINRAWALALRKRFCRQFNFELQAAATEDALMLSLGPQHSFPLADVFRYLHPASVRDILVQAFLDAPVFATRWRWNTTIALAVPRCRGGRKVAPQLQRMQADDLMAAVFPDAAACLENIPGDREIPDHPLVSQTVRDCLEEAMDLAGLEAILTRIHGAEVHCVSRDTPEPSAFAHEILNARPYAFLDDAPLEERRAHAVQTRRASDLGSDVGTLDAAAIDRVRDEARPDPRDADELHDALLTAGYLLEEETDPALVAALIDARRATRVVHRTPPLSEDAGQVIEANGARANGARANGAGAKGEEANGVEANGVEADLQVRLLLVAAERLPEMVAVHPNARMEPAITPPPSRAARAWSRHDALVELLRGRLVIVGPVTASRLAGSIGVPASDVDEALLALEAEGVVLRGVFTPPSSPGASAPGSRSGLTANRRPRALEWCDRGLLARIHRYTLHRLRAEIAPVSQAEFMRFQFAWQHVDPSCALSGPDGLRSIIAQLDGLELPARAWERAVLPARLDRYEPSMLDMLCLTGEVGWARLSAVDPSARSASSRARSMDGTFGAPPSHGEGSWGPTQVVGATQIALFLREHADAWLALRTDVDAVGAATGDLTAARDAGAPRSRPIVHVDHHASTAARRPAADIRVAAARILERLTTHGASFGYELAAACELKDEEYHTAIVQLVAAGLVSSDGFAGLRALIGASPNDPPARLHRPDTAGRWSAVRGDAVNMSRVLAVEMLAWTLLRRYGVVFRRLVARDTAAVPWRELVRVYRILEARGDIRGGRFVTGMSGEQFASAEAVDRLREVRRSGPDTRLLTISAADPLNLTGIITPGERIRASTANRIVYRNGVPVAAMEGDMLRTLSEVEPAVAAEAAAAAAGRRVPVMSGYVGRMS